MKYQLFNYEGRDGTINVGVHADSRHVQFAAGTVDGLLQDWPAAQLRIARFIAQLPLAAETMEPAQIRFLPPLSQPGVIYGGRGELPRPCRGHGKGLQYGPDDRSEGRWRTAVALHQGRPGDTVRPPPGAALSLAHANARLGG
ncbi:hypothetical protein D3C72_1877320 [compost metagenome]